MLSIVLNVSQNIEICKVQCPLDVPAHLCRVSKTSQRGDINWARHKSAFDLLRAAHMVHKVETSRSCSAQQDFNNTHTQHDRLNAPFVSCTGPTSVVTAKIWRGHLIDLDVKFRRRVFREKSRKQNVFCGFCSVCMTPWRVRFCHKFFVTDAVYVPVVQLRFGL